MWHRVAFILRDLQHRLIIVDTVYIKLLLSEMHHHTPRTTANIQNRAAVFLSEFAVHHEIISFVVVFGVVVACDGGVEHGHWQAHVEYFYLAYNSSVE